MVVLQATKLNLSPPPPPQPISSLLLDPHSLSLVLMHFDSSFSLYPSISPFSSPSSLTLSPPQTLIPPPSSSSAFLRLHNPNPNSTPRVLFLVTAPHLGGAAVLLRFWILRKKSQSFAKTLIICNQSNLNFDNHKSGVVFSVNHGVSIKLVSSVNVFAMYSISNGKIWIFSAKMADDNDDGVSVKLMKCATIDCSLPVFSISVSFGFLILGEEHGVRVFPLRPLVKGRVKKTKPEKKILNGELKNEKLMAQRSNLPNGTIQSINGINDLESGDLVTGESSFNGNIRVKTDVKLRSLKLRQDSREGGACFVPMKGMEVETVESTKMPPKSAKVVSIEALSPNNFLILDSIGNLHLLCLSNHVLGSETPPHMKCLMHSMKVQKLAVLPDTSIRTPTIWVSDGRHTVHMMTLSDMDTSINESDKKETDEKLMQISVGQAIFSGEKIQDIIPLSANAVMILGQGSIFAYAIS